MFFDTYTLLDLTKIMMGLCLTGVALYVLLRKSERRSSHNPIHSQPSTNQHWIEQSSIPMLVFSMQGVIIHRNPAFDMLCPTKINLDLLNQVHHYLPELNLENTEELQGPMLLLDQRQHSWHIYCIQDSAQHKVLQLIPCQTAATPQLTSETLHIMQQLMQSVAYDTKNTVNQIQESIQKIANMHNFDSEKSQFFVRKFNLERDALKSYFLKNNFNSNLINIKQATSKLQQQLERISPTKSMIPSKRSTFASNPGVEQAFEKMLQTKAAHYLTHQGYTPITFSNTAELNLEFHGEQSLFVSDLSALYEWISIPICDQLEKINESPETISILKKCATIDLHIASNSDSLTIVFTGYFLQGHSLLKQISAATPHDVSRASNITTEGLLSLIHFQSLFQADITTTLESFQNQDFTTHTQPINEFKLTLNFPANLALNRADLQQKFHDSDAGSTMRDDPVTEEFLDALTHDVETITFKKPERDFTIH